MKLTFDMSELKSKLIDPLQGSDRRVRAAVATALTKTAVLVREAERREMRDVFDRPTPYTLNSLYVKPATAASGEAAVGVKNDTAAGRSAVAWLKWHIRGGLRRLTGFERALVKAGAMDGGDRAIPAAYAKLDAFGNMSRGQMAQVLSQLRVETGRAGSTRTLPSFSFEDNKRERNRKRTAIVGQYRRAGGQYLALPYGRGKLKAGLYLLDKFNSRDVQPVMVFVSKAQYEPKRFDFYYVAQTTIKRELSGQMSGALARSLLQGQTQVGTRVSIA